MRVSEAIANATALLGQEVEVVGQLVSNAEATYVEGEESLGSLPSRISLPHPDVQDALLDRVPVLLGGPNLYDESCLVVGSLIAQTPGSLQLAPTRIELRSRAGEIFKITVPVKPDNSLERMREI